MVEIGDLSARLEVDGLSGFTSDLGRARSEAEQTGAAVDEALDVDTSEAQASIGGLGDRLSGLGAGFAVAGGAAAAAGVAIVSSALSSGRELRGLSQAARLNVEDLQAMGAVARQTGGDVEDIADASRELQLRLAEATSLGTGPAVDALNLLGLSIEDIQNLNPEESFALIRDRLSEIEDPAQRAFLAEELLGGSTERLTGFIEANADAFREQIAAIEASGAVISEDAVNANAAAADAIDTVTASVGALASELVANLSPALVTAAGAITTVTGALREGEQQASALEDRQVFLALALDQATQSTVDLSFGTVGLKGEYEDLEEVALRLQMIHEGLDASLGNVYGQTLVLPSAVDDTTAAYEGLALALALVAEGYSDTFSAARGERTAARAGRQTIGGSGEVVGTRGDPSRNLRFELAELRRNNLAGLGDGVETGPGSVVGVLTGSAETIAADAEERADERFFEQIETLYANNRINDLQYEALLTSNDLGETLSDLVETASAEELRALDQVRTGLFRIGEIDAQGSRAIVQAIQGLGAALALGGGGVGGGGGLGGGIRLTNLSGLGIPGLEQTRLITNQGRPVGITGGRFVGFGDDDNVSASEYTADPVGYRRRRGGFDPVSQQALTVNVMVDGETLASGQVGEVQRALNRGEITVHASP